MTRHYYQVRIITMGATVFTYELTPAELHNMLRDFDNRQDLFIRGKFINFYDVLDIEVEEKRRYE